MVKLKPFSTDIDAPDEGPCRRIVDEFEEELLRMLSLTDDRGSEHAMIVVEMGGELGRTVMTEGEETAMSRTAMAELEQEATRTAMDMNDGEQVNIREYKTHRIHSHPRGHLDMSLRDVESIIDNYNEQFPAQGPSSHLLTVDAGNGKAILGGLYRTDFPTEEEVRKAKAMLQGIENIMTDQYTRTSQKRELLNRLTDMGFKACSTTFNVQG